jgi:hypothetical protein
MSESESNGSPFVHMSGSEIHRYSIVKKHLPESENRLFVVPITTQWLDVRPSRTVQSNISFIFSHQRTIDSFLFWCFQFKLGIRKSPVPVILWNSCNEPKGLLPFVDNRPHTGVWRLPKFKPQYFSSRDLDRISRPRSSRARSA